MIIGSALTIDGQTYELSTEMQSVIAREWEKCQAACDELERAHAKETEETKVPGMFLDDSNPSQIVYQRFCDFVRRIVVGQQA